MCIIVGHKCHNSGEIPAVANNFRPKIIDDDRQAMSALSTISEQLRDTKKAAEEFLSSADDVKKVLAVGEELKRVIDRRMNGILTKLETVTSESARQAEYVEESYQLAMASLERFHRDAQDLLDKGPLDVTRGDGELHDRAVELLHNDVTAIKYYPFHVKFMLVDIAGHISYVQDMFIAHLANVVEWDERQQRAFVQIKNILSKEPILKLPDLERPFIVQTDASDENLGACLIQEYDGVKHPVMFASKKLLPREQNYSVSEREALAIIWAANKFHRFLYGAHFVLESDHRPLEYLQSTHSRNARSMRCSLALQSKCCGRLP